VQRTILTRKDHRHRPTAQAATEIPGVPDSYSARLLKLIPAEVISLYVSLTALASTAHPRLPWIIFAIALLGVPFHLLLIAKVTKPRQVLLSTVAFAIWTLAIGSPFGDQARPYGAMALLVFTFASPAFIREA
jgi:hypothetical protein